MIVIIMYHITTLPTVDQLLPHSFTHEGTAFCFAFIRNSAAAAAANGGGSRLAVHVTSAGTQPVDFTVTIGTSRDQFGILFESRGVARPGEFTTVDIPIEAEAERGVFRRKGVELSAVGGSVVVIASSVSNTSSDTALVYPLQSYVGVASYEYHAFSTTNSDSASDSVVLIASCDNDIDVQLTVPPRLNNTVVIPQEYTLSGLPERPPANTPFSILPLLRRAATHIHDAANDLSQFKVTTTAPVGVLTGHTCGTVPAGVLGCSLVMEQIPPTLTWGYTFFTSPLAEREGEVYKIITSREAAVNVTCAMADNNSTLTQQYQVADNGLIELNSSSLQYCCIQSNAPTAVVQYAVGHSYDETRKTHGELGDPFMILIPPVEQYINNVTFTTDLNVNDQFNRGDYISIAVPLQFFNTSMIVLDGSDLSGLTWYRIQCSNGQLCGMGTNTNVSRGFHRLAHLNPNAALSVTVYGWGDRQSYGYTAGQRMDPIGCKWRHT